MDYTRFVNKISARREKLLYLKMWESYIGKSAPADIVYMGAGFPNVTTFPIKDATFSLDDGQILTADRDCMKEALQYTVPQGMPQFLEQLREIVRHYHSPPNWEERDVAVTTGSTDAIAKIVEMTLDMGDYVIIPDPVYQSFLTVANVYQPHYLSVATDDEGMLPEALRKVLSPWKADTMRNALFGVPKIMYINPCAANPTGATLSNKRRRELYEIASEYNLLILEDDPYYFLQFAPRENWPQSFLSIDTDGRVLRCDSFSKLISPGMRLGYVTGPKELVSKIVLHIADCEMHASSLSQMVASKLLKKWGRSGFDQYMDSVRSWYMAQRDAAVESAKRHLTGLCTWRVPEGGLFFWLKVLNINDSSPLIDKAATKGVTVAPGRAFRPATGKTSPYFRVCYSTVSQVALDKGLQQLGDVIREATLLNELEA